MDERDTKGNIEFQKDATEEQEKYEEEIISEEENTVHDVDSEIVAEDNNDDSSETQRLEKLSQQTLKIGKRRMTSQKSAPSASSQLMNYLIKEKSEQRATSTLTPTHPVDAFLNGIGATLKIFNSYDLIMAKKEIFDVVHKYEMRMSTLSSGHQSGSSGTYRESRQYATLTSPTDITERSFSNISAESHYTNLISPGNMTQYHRADDDNLSERLHPEAPNTLRSFLVNYQDE